MEETQPTPRPTEKARPFNRNLAVLRGIAILYVVSCHTGMGNVLRNFHISPRNWLIATGIDSFQRVMIPFFLMISGALLIREAPTATSLRKFLQRRLVKIYVPYLIWTAIYQSVKYGFDFGAYFVYLLNGKVSYQLYFVNLLVGLYVLFPLMALLFRPENKTLLRYTLLLWTAFIVLVMASRFCALPFDSDLISISAYFGYPILGKVLFDHRDRFPDKRGRLILLRGLGWGLTFAGMLFMVLRNGGDYDGKFFDFRALNVALSAGAGFALAVGCVDFERLPRWTDPIVRALIFLGRDSMFIFFIHVLAMIYVEAFLAPFALPGLVQYAANFTLSLTASLTALFLLRWTAAHVPVLRRAIGWLGVNVGK